MAPAKTKLEAPAYRVKPGCIAFDRNGKKRIGGETIDLAPEMAKKLSAVVE